MKKLSLFILTVLLFLPSFGDEVRLKPYIMAGYEKGELQDSADNVEKLLKEKNFDLLGKYSPMRSDERIVIVATHKLLKDSVSKFGGLLGFASVLRFGLYKNGDNIEISYMNPLYWGNAYFRKKFPEVENNYKNLLKILTETFSGLSEVKNFQFGSKKGLKVKKLRKYHYMVFMPYFDNVEKLAKNTDYKSILDKIELNFSKKIGSVEKVYRLDFPELKLTLFGGALYGKNGESKFIPKIDKADTKHVAFMPYEFLVMENKVVMLHGKFRIALSFPDLSMGTFMKIVSTPGDIEDYFEDIVKK
ncbi:MAG: hypothetical protein ABFR75_04440 [Acidobacteriota bacterium]